VTPTPPIPSDRLARMIASAHSVLAIEFNGTFIILACFVIPVLILYVYAIISLIGRHDLGIGAKLLWLVAILALPIIGSILYFMLRPAPQEQNRRAQARHRH
jgi:Phospholipase_D-nuclease N-terminal